MCCFWNVSVCVLHRKKKASGLYVSGGHLRQPLVSELSANTGGIVHLSGNAFEQHHLISTVSHAIGHFVVVELCPGRKDGKSSSKNIITPVFVSTSEAAGQVECHFPTLKLPVLAPTDL